MNQQTRKPVQLVLTDERGLGKIHVDMDAFFDFSFWMAEELQDLVALRKHATRQSSARPEPATHGRPARGA